MAKDKKNSSTIRRKKGKQVAVALQKLRGETSNRTHYLGSDDQIAATDMEEKCYLFDERVLGASVLRRLMLDNHCLFLTLLAVRFANALLLQTQYVPDEYWQSLEVAHKMVFGYGYLTWEWREGLRGYSYPLLFAFFFKVLSIFGLDSRMMLVKIPRLIQGVIAAYGDLQLYKLSAKLGGRSTAQWTLICQLLSWFTIYCCTRTLSNSTETSLVIAALSYFPLPDYPSKPGDLHKFLLLAALSVIVRPTAALIWMLLCSWHLQRLHGSPMFARVLGIYISVGVSTFAASCVIDRIWYERWTCVQLNFLLFNVIKGGANIYGVHPWHWYISQGFPVILGTFIFPFVIGAYQSKNKTLLWIIVWILATHSFLPHKEFRFVLPALPLAMHYCGVYFQMLCAPPSLKKIKHSMNEVKFILPESSVGTIPNENLNETELEHDNGSQSSDTNGSAQTFVKSDEMRQSDEKEKTSHTKVNPNSKLITEEDKEDLKDDKSCDKSDLLLEKKDLKVTGSIKSVPIIKSTKVSSAEEHKLQEAQRDRLHTQNLSKAKILIFVLALTNLLPALYFCLLHQRATVMVTKYLQETSLTTLDMNVLFLMPCHSTPYYSYIHQNITMRFLTCEPNLLGIANYTEESDLFYQDPKGWLKKEYSNSRRKWPTHIVYFDVLHWDINSVLIQGGYKLCQEFFHTHLPEGRVGGSVYVSCR
ncbi:GPI mannosyltransferase 3-like [Biomphalaria glabrata]|uniref:Mannosyltransferase n=1 Tax=Biomphalaria glabrata TaxID=6526 RepID=A0A9U8E3R1_BIOGL|nr:GPI mannosyltransferase 3-like [Biomphalaria glabrata]